MNKKRKISLALTLVMIFNLFAFPVLASASELNGEEIINDSVIYNAGDDTIAGNDDYILSDENILPEELNARARTTLDIGRGDITITANGVTGKTTSGANATHNPEGYIITGSTTQYKVVVNDSVRSVIIENVNMNYSNTAHLFNAINFSYGGILEIRGTNRINRTLTVGTGALIRSGAHEGRLTIVGTGNLIMDDRMEYAATIGGNQGEVGRIYIAGNVNIRATQATNILQRAATIGGGWSALGHNTEITIGEYATVYAHAGNESYGAAIGGGGGQNSHAIVKIDGRAKVEAYAGRSRGAAIGGGGASATPGNGTVTVGAGAEVRVVAQEATGSGNNAGGMGTATTGGNFATSSVHVSPMANVWGSISDREKNTYNLYDDIGANINGRGYRRLVSGFGANVDVSIEYGKKTTVVKTNEYGYLELYFPAGQHQITINGVGATVENNTNHSGRIRREPGLAAIDINEGVRNGSGGTFLTGHATSRSDARVVYSIFDAGTTGASLTQTVNSPLSWTAPGTMIMTATVNQTDAFLRDVVKFSITVKERDGVLGVLDITHAPIKITRNNLDAMNTEKEAALFDPDGYEIVGSTDIHTITVGDRSIITINGIKLDYPDTMINSGIEFTNGGTLNIKGTNTLTRPYINNSTAKAMISSAINLDSLSILGDGTLNITDGTNTSAVIGGNNGNGASVNIAGNVVINAKRADSTEEQRGAVIGGGNDSYAKLTTINISENAMVNADAGENSSGAAIGAGRFGNAVIKISDRAEVNASGGAVRSAVIGGGAKTKGSSQANGTVTIEDGTKVKVIKKDLNPSLGLGYYNGGGMGLSAQIEATDPIPAVSTVNISSLANIDAPISDIHYKSMNNSMHLYKTKAHGFKANEELDVSYKIETVKIKADNTGTLYLYLPQGEQKVTIASDVFDINVKDVINDIDENIMAIQTVLTAPNATKHVSLGLDGINLRGYETTNSMDASITYTIKDAGTTEAVLSKNKLTWSKSGIISMNVSQPQHGKYSQASTDFTVTIVDTEGDIQIDISVDASSVGFGKAIVIDKDGNEILPIAPAGDILTIKAIPNAGYELAKWVKQTKDADGTVVKTEELAPNTILKVTADAEIAYVAHFKILNLVSGPTLDILEVWAPTIQANGTTLIRNKVLVRQDGSEDTKFDSNKLEYGLYLRSIDTDNINVYVSHSDTDALSIKVGNKTETSVNPADMYKVDIKLANTTYQEINIVVTRGSENTTYVIKVFKPATEELDPHIFAELEASQTKEVLGLNIYAVNVDVSAFSITIRLSDLFTGTNKAFEGFSDNAGTVFNDFTQNLANKASNYLNLDGRFEIAAMKSDGTLLHLTINARSGPGAVKIGAAPERIITVSLKRNRAYTGDVTKEIETLILDAVQRDGSTYANNLSSKLYGAINDTVGTSTDEDKKTLSYLQYSSKLDTIKMHVNYDSNTVGRVKYEILDVSDSNNIKIVVSGDLVNKKIEESVVQGTYVVKLLANGYLLAESENIVYDGNPSIVGIILTPVRLIEGDLDANNSIDGEDRIKLLSVLNRVVETVGSGFVVENNTNIYADYNDDDQINSLDLGRLIQNIGKTYSPIQKK